MRPCKFQVEKSLNSDASIGSSAGWGRLRYFDLEERQIGYRTTLANIPKVGTQWKIIHDFKPTAYLTDDNCNGNTEPATISVNLINSDSGLDWGHYCMVFDVGDECVRLYADALMPPEESMQLPTVGEWTRVELTHEFDDNAGKYFISLSFDGVEVIRDEDFFADEANPDVDLWDIRIGLGELNVQQFPGFIRRLIVLEKS